MSAALSSSCLCSKSSLEKQNCLQFEMDNQTLLTAASPKTSILGRRILTQKYFFVENYAFIGLI